MRHRFQPLVACLVLVAVFVSGCTNTRQDVSLLSYTQQTLAALRTQGRATPPDPRLVEAAVSQALATTNGALALLRVDTNANVALLTEIERNGAYRTWAAFGTAERRSITSRAGVVTATRGLGGDLMSSSQGQLLELVSKRRAGQATLVLRHIGGEGSTDETLVTCTVRPNATELYQQGTLRQTVTRVTASCTTDMQQFDAYYLVTSAGRILEARQWLGPLLGMVTFQQLR